MGRSKVPADLAAIRHAETYIKNSMLRVGGHFPDLEKFYSRINQIKELRRRIYELIEPSIQSRQVQSVICFTPKYPISNIHLTYLKSALSFLDNNLGKIENPTNPEIVEILTLIHGSLTHFIGMDNSQNYNCQLALNQTLEKAKSQQERENSDEFFSKIRKGKHLKSPQFFDPQPWMFEQTLCMIRPEFKKTSGLAEDEFTIIPTKQENLVHVRKTAEKFYYSIPFFHTLHSQIDIRSEVLVLVKRKDLQFISRVKLITIMPKVMKRNQQLPQLSFKEVDKLTELFEKEELISDYEEKTI